MEQALPDSACVVYRVCSRIVPDSDYPVLLEQVFPDTCSAIEWPGNIEAVCSSEGTQVGLSETDREKVEAAYDRIALAIEAFEASPEVNAFTSKYDYHFKGKAKLSQKEQKGFSLFRGKGKCQRCHPSNGQDALFTDFTYDNLGIPRNPANPFYEYAGDDYVDLGLGGFFATRPDYQEFAAANYGKHKVPTLRNVGKGSCEAEPQNTECMVKPFSHNGYFKSLRGIVHFYNTRDVKKRCPDGFTTEEVALSMNCWPVPEYPENINLDELGDLGLTPDEEDAIVAFLMTLSDGFMLEGPNK